MTVALKSDDVIPIVGTVTEISKPQEQITVELMVQERAPHKPKWLRSFRKTEKITKFSFHKIVLYDFKLTKRGCFNKRSRDYLMDKN